MRNRICGPRQIRRNLLDQFNGASFYTIWAHQLFFYCDRTHQTTIQEDGFSKEQALYLAQQSFKRRVGGDFPLAVWSVFFDACNKFATTYPDFIHIPVWHPRATDLDQRVDACQWLMRSMSSSASLVPEDFFRFLCGHLPTEPPVVDLAKDDIEMVDLSEDDMPETVDLSEDDDDVPEPVLEEGPTEEEQRQALAYLYKARREEQDQEKLRARAREFTDGIFSSPLGAGANWGATRWPTNTFIMCGTQDRSGPQFSVNIMTENRRRSVRVFQKSLRARVRGEPLEPAHVPNTFRVIPDSPTDFHA